MRPSKPGVSRAVLVWGLVAWTVGLMGLAWLLSGM